MYLFRAEKFRALQHMWLVPYLLSEVLILYTIYGGIPIIPNLSDDAIKMYYYYNVDRRRRWPCVLIAAIGINGDDEVE